MSNEMVWQLAAFPRPVPLLSVRVRWGQKSAKAWYPEIPGDTLPMSSPPPMSPVFLPKIKTVFDVTGELMVSARNLHLESPKTG